MKKRILLAFMIISIVLTSCATPAQTSYYSTDMGETQKGEFTCLEGQVSFAYPISETVDGPANIEQVLPGLPWQKVSTYQNEDQSEVRLVHNSYVLQKNKQGDKIWANFSHFGGLVFYDLNSQTWEQVIEPDEELDYLRLFIDNDNAIWAYRLNGYNDPNMLYKLDEEAGRFIPLLSKADIFKGNENDAAIMNLIVDYKGVFWITLLDGFSQRRLLFIYDQQTGKSENLLSDVDLYYSLASSSQGKVYVSIIQSNAVIEYDDQTGEYRQFNIPKNLHENEIVTLYYDNEERLWLGNAGYFDFSYDQDHPLWYELIRPTFLLSYIVPAGMWKWNWPTFTHESPNGLLWFTVGEGGTGWVDPNIGEWCLFTTEDAPVHEDSRGNLWILIEDTLYELDKTYSN